MGKHTEMSLEEAIILELIAYGGYIKGDSRSFDKVRALFPNDVISFIAATQSKKWEAMQELLAARSEDRLIYDLTQELALKGSLHVLRHGFKSFGKNFRLACFAPNTNRNPKAQKDYEKNILTVTHQVYFSLKNPNLSLDVVLSVNGLPIVTLEIENHRTGQTIENAFNKYKYDFQPTEPIFRFKERALVHFAVDPDVISMTTKLEGKDTVFLPFNKGYQEGAGNSPREFNYKTAYLWESVLPKDSLLDILARFMHLQVEKKQSVTTKGIFHSTKETMIFPRYHQLDCVRHLITSATIKGAGHNYLIQHSAGSGKSNSITWLAHHLSSLHHDWDEKVFDSVIVITDRKELVKQLQNTIYQFDRKQGVVQRIYEDTRQQAKALSGDVPIIISTIQNFPSIARAISKLEKNREDIKTETSEKRFAIIVDDAHSPQSEETAMELIKVLNGEGIVSVVAAQLLEMNEEELSEDTKKAILTELLKRPQQKNISYFAFTAKPKFKTLAVFKEIGVYGKPPFHYYGMKQAIEEGFIMDVLEHYSTYETYFNLLKSIEDDPQVTQKKAALSLARYMSLQPHNISQKVEVIVEHFISSTRHLLGGRAKAMVVISSPLYAVKYKLEFDKYLKEKAQKNPKRYLGIKSLVAFSGIVIDPDFPDVSYTETGMNNDIKENELFEKFNTEEFQLLFVAEKYQTSIDQPLLHTMYVDKRLSGIQAVQTLSRLNQKAPGKETTFVLDFVNEREKIFEYFKPYYNISDLYQETDPKLLYGLQNILELSGIFTSNEVNAFCEVWFKSIQEITPHDYKINSILGLALDRFDQLHEEKQEEFKSTLLSFRNLYAFLSQIIPYQNSDIEKLYTYLRFLYLKLPKRQTGKYELENEMLLKYYRLQKINEGIIKSETGEPDAVVGPMAVITCSAKENQYPLSTIVKELNYRFGTKFTLADQLFLDQVIEIALEDEKIRNAAEINNYDNFMYYFEKMLECLFVDRLEGNKEIFTKLMNDDKMMLLVAWQMGINVYDRIRKQCKRE
jgi:type I restriction enzyme R subunit